MTTTSSVQSEGGDKYTKDSANSKQSPYKEIRWIYNGQQPLRPGEDVATHSTNMMETLKQCVKTMDLGNYQREKVTNISSSVEGREYFDFGLRFMMSYQHEMAALYFFACLQLCPHAALAHGLLSLCHAPNYNFKGDAYYESTFHYEDIHLHDMQCIFPSQQVADRHSAAAIAKIEELRRQHRQRGGGKKKNSNNAHKGKQNKTKCDAKEADDEAKSDEQGPEVIADVEAQLLAAIRILTGTPGVDPDLSCETVGRPYADAMRKVYQKYPGDPDIVYFFAESLMVLNAWQLYEFASGKPLSPDVEETRSVLEQALVHHPHHPGLCHMYVHLSEMSAHPEKAIVACEPLRSELPHAGHLLHMPSHIDVLLGEYEKCVRYNLHAIQADLRAMEFSPLTAGFESFYFGYIVHNFHMAVYGAILGGMEGIGMQVAHELNEIVNETMFHEYPNLVAYLEAYSALDIHVMVRFGRWEELLLVEMPQDKTLMLFRASSIYYARALALAMTGNIAEAKKEADRFDTLRKNHPEASERILHNNSIADLLAVDAAMMRGEIAYKEGKHTEGLALLRKAVDLQDNLNFDEPWGKMQPIRHALGGLLLEQGQFEESEAVFRKDLKLHPRNPWGLVGLIRCLERNVNGSCCSNNLSNDVAMEISDLRDQLRVQRQMEWADFDVVVACECCTHPAKES